MTSTVFLLYALIHAALFAWALALLVRYRHAATVPLLIVTFGLIYDNAMLAAGGAIGHGELLERLSVPRFFMHAVGTPLLMLAALALMRRAGVKWARTSLAAIAIAGLTPAMIAVGFDADMIGLQLEAKSIAGVVSYGNAATSGPPIAPTVTIAILIAAGVGVWRHGGGPWLLLGSLVQLAAAMIGDAIVIAGNLGEVALLAGLVVTDSRLSRRILPEAPPLTSG